MSNADDVLDNWEEIDEAGLESKLDKLKRERQEPSKNQLEHQQEEHNICETAMSFQNSIPMMMVMQQTENEYKSSNYTTQAMPAVKILRRPAQQNSGSNRDNGIRPKQPIKTLQQREQEYAEARLRILGSAKNPEDDMETSGATPSVIPKVNLKSPADISNICSHPSLQQQQQQALTVIQMSSKTSLSNARSPSAMMNNSNSPVSFIVGVGASGGSNGGNGIPINMYSPTSSMIMGGVNIRYNENILRMPRGPDGTSGFQMRR